MQACRKLTKLCELPAPHEGFVEDASPLIYQLRRRQFDSVHSFYTRLSSTGTSLEIDATAL
jgi:hypothetical protein